MKKEAQDKRELVEALKDLEVESDVQGGKTTGTTRTDLAIDGAFGTLSKTTGTTRTN